LDLRGHGATWGAELTDAGCELRKSGVRLYVKLARGPAYPLLPIPNLTERRGQSDDVHPVLEFRCNRGWSREPTAAAAGRRASVVN
jgi:hypothetical protein